MHLTPENAPVGARVLVDNGDDTRSKIEIVHWDDGGDSFYALWPGRKRWMDCGEVSFIRRLDHPEPAPPGLGGVDRDRIYKVALERSRDLKGDAHLNFTTPGNSVTIERERAAMDALRRLAAKAMGISVVSDDVNVESLEAIICRRIDQMSAAHDMLIAVDTIAEGHGWKRWVNGGSIAVDQWLDSELSALREFRRASEQLAGEGDAVEWKPLPADFGQGNTTGSPGYSRGFGWCMLSDGARVSEFFQPPHPDLHPVRVDGVWRWVRKEKV